MPEEEDSLEAWMRRSRRKRQIHELQQRVNKSRARGFSATRVSLDEIQLLLDERTP